MDRSKVAEALCIALAASLSEARLPLLTDAEHAAVCALRTTAQILDLTEIDREITALIEADKKGFGSRFCRSLRQWCGIEMTAVLEGSQ